MKIKFFILLLFFYSCETKSKNSFSENYEIEKSLQKKIKTENRKYFVGDIDNDKVDDTAFINYKWNVETNEIECGKNNCVINIEFNKNKPSISFSQSLGIVVTKVEDVNKDNSNEIIVFSRTNEGLWYNISVWSFKNKNWKEIAKTNALLRNDKDSENRVIKENGKYYLIGDDKWNEDEKGDFKKIKLKL